MTLGTGNHDRAFALLALFSCVMWCTSLAAGDDEDSPQEFPFARSPLLEQFEADGDGHFSDSELRKLRDAFGGIDVPMLPDEPFNYGDVKRPAYLDRDELAAADNTPPDNPTTDAGAALGRKFQS